MSVTSYSFNIYQPYEYMSKDEFKELLSIWRSKCETSNICTTCQKRLDYKHRNFGVCCQTFYLKKTKSYLPRSIAVPIKQQFVHHHMRKMLAKFNIHTDQKCIVFSDPIYWLIKTSLIYNKLLISLDSDNPMKNPFDIFENTPLNHCSINTRHQGKKSIYRVFATAKRVDNTGRGMIIPAPHLKPNEIALPASLALSDWVIINRLPTLHPGNFTAHKVVEIWDHPCIGVPCEILRAQNGDFDGDELNIWPLTNYDSLAECVTLLNSECNMRCFVHDKIKLYPSQDMIVTFYLMKHDKRLHDCFPVKLDTREEFTKTYLMDVLKSVYELFGSRVCFDTFDKLRLLYLDYLENERSFSVCFKDFDLSSYGCCHSYLGDEMIDLQANNSDDNCIRVQILSETKGTVFHMNQLIKTVGEQYLKYGGDTKIESSFLAGLTPYEYLIHAQSGFEALIESFINIWYPGYLFFRLCNNLQDLMVNYKGQVVDSGERIIYDDVLSAMSPSDLIEKQTFKYLVEKWWGK